MITIKSIKNIFIALFAITLVSCGGGDSEGGPDVVTLGKAVLVLPINNAECNQGNVISEQESKVYFEWNTAENADSYSIKITNLDDNSVKSLISSNTNIETALLRGVPYSWSVTAKSNGAADTTSDTWKFFNAGDGVQNYAPFPADLVSPAMGSSVDISTTIEWTGSDIDGDIDEYDVYLSTTNPPTELKGTTSSTTMNNLSLESGKVYYWKVVTKDSFGNNSESPVFEFRTN
ncbi:hypothetical protein BW723_03880 [Polaribacter reichenbachii]|uniref:Fibronectin type-III domain-containing protein n=1 Tax=Polaribacter reichenbachii TaxID=996801 RepID=A0A1B8TUK9_9FLAO|nr:hypothetical protein [Polaribacter reichenbachii]APZ45488.1 hypothetical protein BW723_03880 [Polaribacter reichenbachii]AUC19349.1 hypothetical protein BTO17_11885 [Polaribacter reichenbachii]OBY63496.1 hypothetical protein LPB301_11825 [Polaribacter reichenbachii]